MKLPGFSAGAYTSLSVNADCQSCVNLYPESIESQAGKNSGALYLTPGLSLLNTLPTSPVRGIWAGEGRCFVVSGSKLYEINESGTPINGIGLNPDRGDVGNDGRLVQMHSNGNQLIVISNQQLYCDNGTGPVPPVFGHFVSDVWTDDDPANPVTARQGAILDSYFLAVDKITLDDPDSPRKFRHSQALDGTQWSILDYASKEAYADQLNGMLVSHEDLWLFGSQTTEVWRNNYSTAPESFPWERDPGAMINYGITGEFSHTKLAEGVAWLAGDPRGYVVAVFAEGYRPKRVSTHAIEQEWATYSTCSDAESFAYTENGHQFWWINFPSANRTWVWDATTQLWHRRGWWNGSSLDRHRARCHASVLWPSGHAHHIVGDWQNGKLYKMSAAYYDDAGTAIHWERTCPHNAEEQKRIFFSRMEIECEKATSATISLSWSNDSGKNFTTPISASNGTTDTTTRLFWHRLGSGRGRVFRFSGAASSKVALIDAYMRAQAGAY